MKVIFTLHVEEKLLEEDSRDLGITKDKIIAVLEDPIITDKKVHPHHSVGSLDNELSLNVIWKTEKGGIIKAITFYPAEKGRYESKILRRR